jgi:hypothetical protein
MIDCDFSETATTGIWKCRRCKTTTSEKRRYEKPPKRNCQRVDRSSPCQHLGDKLGTQECQGCQGTVRIKLFACEVHGQCTLGKKLDGTACCANCLDYQPSKRDADPDSGVAG